MDLLIKNKPDMSTIETIKIENQKPSESPEVDQEEIINAIGAHRRAKINNNGGSQKLDNIQILKNDNVFDKKRCEMVVDVGVPDKNGK